MKHKLLAVAAALMTVSAVACAQPYGMGPGMIGWGGGWGWSWFGIVHMVLWWFLIILGIVVLAKRLFGRGGSGRGVSSEDRALVILRERYARGDIDNAEFDARKRDLEH